MTDLLDDLRLAVRTFARTPAVSFVAALALALTIGVGTAIFSVVDAALLRPLPYDRPEAIVTVWESWRDKGFDQLPALPADFVEWRKQARSFAGLAGSWALDVNLTGAGDAQRLRGARVSSNLFPLLGVRPAIGRAFAASDDRFGAPRVAILSDGLWRRQYGANAGVIGRQIALDGASYTVVGVMPRTFAFSLNWGMTGLVTTPVEVWIPLALNPAELNDGFELNIIGRLKPGVSISQADADIGTIGRHLAEKDPDRKGIGTAVVPLRDLLTRDVRPAILALAAAVGLVLLITCANVANLLLAKAAAREREIAVRAALGASHPALFRQLLSEGLVLAGAGGAIGVALAYAATGLLARWAPPAVQRAGAIRIDARVLTFTLIISVLAGIVCGLAPIFGAFRVNLEEALRQSGRGSTGTARQGRIRSALVVAEIALALLLVVGSGLLLNSFLRLVSVDPGFNTTGLTSFHLSLPDTRYASDERRAGFYRDLLARLRAMPEVEQASLTTSLPLEQAREVFYNVGDRVEADARKTPVGISRMVDGEYFRLMGIRLVRGRFIAPSDGAGSLPVVVINEALARRHWPGQDPIGRLVKEGLGTSRHQWMTVVGVVGDVRQYALGTPEKPGIYVSYLQFPRADMTVVARPRSASVPLATAVRAVVRQIDPDQPVDAARTIDDLVAASLAPRRFSMSLLTAFAVLALTLAAVGVYAVMSYVVSLRAREFAIRKALGARPRQVIALVLWQGVGLTAVGLLVGCPVAIATSRLLASQLYGVGAADPVTFVAAAAVLLGTGLAACYLPARAGNRIDAIETLRQE